MTTKTLNISDEDRALLTAEELAGMEEGEEFDESGESESEGAAAATGTEAAAGTDATSAEADAAGKTEDGKAETDDAAGKADDTAAAAAAADGKGADDTAAAPNAEEIAFASVPPVPVSKLPDDYEDKVKAVATDKKALAEQLDEGDINMSEYHEKLDALNRSERELERTKDRVDASEHRRYETWTNIHVIGFMKQHPAYSENEMLTGLLDQEVRKLQAAGKFGSDTDPQILIEAHKKIATSFPGTFTAAAPAKTTAKEPGKPAVRNTAPSLAKVPAANIDEPGEGEFSSLDRLLDTDPLGWERACERLSKSDPAKYEQYLAQ